MHRRSRPLLIAGVGVVAAALLAIAVGAASGSEAARKPSTIVFPVSMIEIKGSTTADKLAPPPRDPSGLSRAYGYKAPGVADASAPTKWEVAVYTFSPSFVTVCQGDTVTLRIFGVNGDVHQNWIQAPSGKALRRPAEHNRGREYLMSFKASQIGVYRLICNTHAPTMTADIRVLPARACS